jgi:hypothetical protein
MSVPGATRQRRRPLRLAEPAGASSATGLARAVALAARFAPEAGA